MVQGADFEGADLTDAIIDPAMVASLELQGVTLTSYTGISDAELRSALRAHEAWVRSNGKVGTRCCLSRFDLAGRSLRGISLALGMLKGARLQHSDLANAILARSDLALADLRSATLADTDLRGIRLQRAHLEDADLSHADLGPLSDVGSKRQELFSDLRHAKFHRAKLCGADLRHANLAGVDFSEADLTGADLSHATLDDADFTGANLQGANLDDARCLHARGLPGSDAGASARSASRNPPDFVRTRSYFGPDRRERDVPPGGPDRRTRPQTPDEPGER
jgi:uncharacterized protein YjbI with pentapeptide repeats